MRERTTPCRAWLAAALAAAAVWTNAAVAANDCRFFVRAGFVASGTPDGLSPASAFSTITDGVAAVRFAGDIVCVGPGLYAEGNLGFGRDAQPGVEGFPVGVRGDATGASTDDTPGPVQIIPPNGTGVTTAFLILGGQYVLIEGFDISGFSDAGIQVRATAEGVNSANITIRNNTVHDCAKAGIEVIAQDVVVVEGNTATGNGETGISVQMCLASTPTGKCRGTSGIPVVPMVSNNRSGGNLGHGIFIQNTDGGIVQNNAVYTNDLTGISLRAAPDAVVANNLIYDNGQQGLAIGKENLGTPGVVVVNNTIYGNFAWGIDLGSDTGASPDAAVVNNIVWRNANGEQGIGVLNEASGNTPVRPPSVCGYVAGFNVVPDAFGPKTPQNTYHFRDAPQFVDPAGPDGVLGGERVQAVFVDRSADDNFRLRQLRGEQGVSPGVDEGSTTVAEEGLTGSTASDGRPDVGVVDIGYHYGASSDQVLDLPTPFMPLYVRKSGSDTNDGFSPGNAFATIAAGALRAEAGITVVVGPGSYDECDIHSPSARGKATFLADPSGELSGDLPGAVLLDAGHCQIGDASQAPVAGETGFDISGVCGVVVDGFHITGVVEDAIRVDSDSDDAEIRNNVVWGSGKRAVRVINSQRVGVRNNLLFENGGGIQLGGQVKTTGETDAGSRDSIIEFNTVFNSDFNGIQVGDGIGISSGGTVRYNVTGASGRSGIEVGDDSSRSVNLVGYTSAYNFVGDRFAGVVLLGAGDVVVNLAQEPLYMDPTAIAVDGDWLLDQHWRLKQTAAGQSPQSRAVDFSDVTAKAAGLSDRSTRTDGLPDSGLVDRGYHYPRRSAGGLAGDCNGDGRVAINELVIAVNIALGNAPMSACVAVDADGSGSVEINELVRAVNNATQG